VWSVKLQLQVRKKVAPAFGIAPHVCVARVQLGAGNEEARINGAVSVGHASIAADPGPLQNAQVAIEEQQAGSGSVVANVRVQVRVATRNALVVLFKAVRADEFGPSAPQMRRGAHYGRVESKPSKRHP
jgi:hypothetical protein